MHFESFEAAARAAFGRGRRSGMRWTVGVEAKPATDAATLLEQIDSLRPAMAVNADGLPADVTERGLVMFAEFLRAELAKGGA